jgi:hypothetical protein
MPRQQDDDDRPRRRRPADDDDDERPKARRKPSRDDDDGDRPVARRTPRRDEEDDDRPAIRRRRDLDDDDDERPRTRRRKKKAKVPPVGTAGLVALALGLLAVLMYFTCCGPLSLVPAGVGLFLGWNGYAMAQKSNGRQTPIVPLIGFVLCLVVTVLALVSTPSFIRGFQRGYEESMSRHGH